MTRSLLQVQQLLLSPETAASICVVYAPVLARLTSQAVDALCAGLHATDNSASISTALVDILSMAPYLERYTKLCVSISLRNASETRKSIKRKNITPCSQQLGGWPHCYSLLAN